MVLYTTDGMTFFNEKLLSYMWNYKDGEVQSILKNVDVKNLVDSYGMTLLHHAVNVGNKTIVKYLIDRGCDVDVLDNCGNTPLMEAVKCKHQAVILILLESNADILLCGQGKRNPLATALAPEYISIVDTIPKFFDILKRKFASDSRQIAKILMDVKCPLPRAMYFKDAVITKYMLDAGCNIDDRSLENGYTALHHAVQQMDVNSVKLLLERGADVFARDLDKCKPSFNFTPGKEESYEMLTILLDYDTSLDASTAQGYEFAAEVLRCGQANEIEVLLNRHEFNLADSFWSIDGECLLHAIVDNDNRDVMQLLEGRHFHVHEKNIEGRTALTYAAEFYNLSALEFLFQHGADPNDEDDAGKSALFAGFEQWAYDVDIVTEENLKCVELFLEYGADVLSRTDEGHTIFDIYLANHQLALILPVISKVAMMEAMGYYIEEDILHKIQKDKRYKMYFNYYKRKIRMLQTTMISGKVSLFHFCTKTDEQLLRCVRNNESAARLRQYIDRERYSNIFFIKCLRKRMQSILQIAELRKKATLSISKMVKSRLYECIIDMVVQLLDTQSLENVCLAT